MKKEELLDWYGFLEQVKNGYHMSDWDKQNFIRLNHLVMEEAHKIHNDNMLGIRKDEKTDDYDIEEAKKIIHGHYEG